jgi:hypothetical protein
MSNVQETGIHRDNDVAAIVTQSIFRNHLTARINESMNMVDGRIEGHGGKNICAH